jgi:hypothetical protein
MLNQLTKAALLNQNKMVVHLYRAKSCEDLEGGGAVVMDGLYKRVSR